jgi:hypothetical protein
VRWPPSLSEKLSGTHVAVYFLCQPCQTAVRLAGKLDDGLFRRVCLDGLGCPLCSKGMSLCSPEAFKRFSSIRGGLSGLKVSRATPGVS